VPPPRIAAVTVAFSRLQLLKEVVAALRGQSRPLDEILVVDHSSDPRIRSWLDAEPGLVVRRQPNAGSAGGFGTGLRLAYERGHDWVWIIDDDGVPKSDALERLVAAPPFAAGDAAFLASRVVTPAGAPQRSYLALGEPDGDACVRVGRATWLGLLVSARAIERCGLPVAEFFIWHEDQEYTERMTRSLRGWCVLSSVIVHHQAQTALDPFTPGGFFKIAHGLRNEFGWIRLGPGSRLRKGLRMARTAARSFVRVLRGELPWKSLAWVARGLFSFRPRIAVVPPRSAPR
jgi:GT2 family glycosyltransferase